MELQVSIIDGKLIPERYQSAMTVTDFKNRIFVNYLREGKGFDG
jgi:DNA primase